MKNAEEFTSIKFHGLTRTEDLVIQKIIDRILANHADDEWWKIELAIKSAVNRKLNIELSNAVFSEKLEREKAREAAEQAEKEKRELEEAEKERLERERIEQETDKLITEVESEINDTKSPEIK
jgi:hypothetical protein